MMVAAKEQEARKKIPHSREAEEALLGSVFINPEAFSEVYDLLQSDDLYIHRNQWVFEGMLDCFVNGANIDIITVGDFLAKRAATQSQYANQLEEVGGAAYLIELTNQSPNSLNVMDYAAIVQGYSVRRKMLDKANKIVALAYDETIHSDKLTVEFDTLVEDRPAPSKTTLVYAKDAGEGLKELVKSGKPQAVQTSLPNENKVFGGYPKEAFTLLIGDSSIGKTAKTFQDGEHLSEQGEHVLFFSFEHSPRRLIARKIFASQGISMIKLRQGVLSAGERAALEKATDEWIHKHPTFVIDNKARTITEMRRSIRQARPALIIVDDTTHIYAEGKSAKSETAILLDTVTKLHDLANDSGGALVGIHHITAEEAMKMWPGGKKPKQNIPPGLDALTWAKDIRYKVDLWLALVPDFQTNVMADHVKIIEWVMKDREGQRLGNSIELYFHKERQQFFDNTNPAGRVVGSNPSVPPANVPVNPAVHGGN